jgi:hypothetical protein
MVWSVLALDRLSFLASDGRVGYWHGERCGSHRADGTRHVIAGDSIVICFNTFKSRSPGISKMIRGEPRVGLAIHHNVYENVHIRASLWAPCRNAMVCGNQFDTKPERSY